MDCGAQPQIVAHRGASALAPENTLAAFQRAVDLDADFFELDCTLTSDGEVIVIHDDTLERTTNGSGRVDEHTLAELKKLDAGSWFHEDFSGQRLPTLCETLELARGKIGVYIEIKGNDKDSDLLRELALLSPRGALLPDHAERVEELIADGGSQDAALARAVVQVIAESSMQDAVVVMSFSPLVLLATMVEAPELRVEFLGRSYAENPAHWVWVHEWIRLLNPRGFNPRREDLTAELVKMLHEHGRSVAVWTVDTAEEMQRVRTLGVDRMITNHPDVARRELFPQS